jgi:hypothetical protein
MTEQGFYLLFTPVTQTFTKWADLVQAAEFYFKATESLIYAEVIHWDNGELSDQPTLTLPNKNYYPQEDI